MILFYVGLGGATGAILRYLVSKLNAFSIFPYGTLIANMLGSFILGYLYFYFEHVLVPNEFKEAITTGLLASFTTYSTIQLQLYQFVQQEQYSLFTLYFFLNIFVGLLCIILAKWIYSLNI